MKERQVNLPTIGLIAGTRAILGVGVGLLLAGKLTTEQRKACGWALLTFGALSTIPLAAIVLGKPTKEEEPTVSFRRNRRAMSTP